MRFMQPTAHESRAMLSGGQFGPTRRIIRGEDGPDSQRPPPVTGVLGRPEPRVTRYAPPEWNPGYASCDAGSLPQLEEA